VGFFLVVTDAFRCLVAMSGLFKILSTYSVGLRLSVPSPVVVWFKWLQLYTAGFCDEFFSARSLR